MIRVAFFINGRGDGWIGGINYIANLVQAVRTVPDTTIQPVIFAAPGQPERVNALFEGVEWIESPHVAGRHPLRIVGKLCERLFGRNPLLEAELRRRRVDVLSHAARPGKRSPFPSIVWVPDLQHRERPEFFSAEERAERDRRLRSSVASATTILLSSHAAERDLMSFLPEAAEKVRVLHFVAGLDRDRPTTSLDSLRDKYNLPPAYFHVPNQFWKHKNHHVVAEALALLSAEGRDFHVISTGATQDYRDPGHFERFQAHLRELGVHDRFRTLGVVPYEDVRGLMRNSMAVINPSFFEGWSTTVEEAKSLGKAVVLSDIPVHREQAPARGIFFPPESAEALAQSLRQATRDFDEGSEQVARLQAERGLQERLHGFALEYTSIVRTAVCGFERKSHRAGE